MDTKRFRGHLTSSLPYLVIFLMGVVLFWAEYNYLARLEEQNLFLHTPLFFKQCMVVPGGLLSWAGAFLTQLLYEPLWGVSVLCIFWAVLVFLMKHVFNIPVRWMSATLVPVAMLLLANVDLGYWIYYLKFRGFFFAPTLGTICAVALTWGYRVLSGWRRMVLLLVTVTCLYPLIGFYALCAAVLMVLVGWRLEGNGRSRAFVDTVVAVLLIVAVPLVYYRYAFHQTPLVNIHWAALPVFKLRMESFPAYYIPYVIVVLSLIVMAICYSDRRVDEKKTMGWMGWRLWLPIVVLAVILGFFWYKDGNFHREITMRKMVDQSDWEGVLKIAKETPDEPTRDMWMMKNLALSRTGQIGESMFDYRNGAKPANSPFTTRLVHWDGKMLYLNYGIPNYCYRWCMEDGVEYGWRVEYLKLMVKCSLVNGELDAAQKYVGLLKKTLFHRKWALHYEEYIHNPRLIMEDAELLQVLHLRGEENYLSSDNALAERFLIEHLAGMESTDPYLQEQALLAAMQIHDPQLFWLQFYQYTELHKPEHVPTLYQQAAYLFGEMDDKVDVGNMPFDKTVVESCKAFLDAFKHYREQGLTPKHIKPLMRSRFQNTFYFDFFFNRYHMEFY